MQPSSPVVAALLSKLGDRFPRRRAVITGAASGLGLATAQLLASDRWRVLLIDRDAATLDAAAAQVKAAGGEASTAVVDVRDTALLQNAIETFAHDHAGLDLALNSAGVAVAGTFAETSLDDWNWIIEINLRGVVASCRAELPWMAQQRSGLVINVASAASFATSPNMSAYNATKAAVVALSETLAMEYAAQGVHVAAAMPGFFQTALLTSARGPDQTLVVARRIMAGSNLTAIDVAPQILAEAVAGRTHIVLPSQYRWLWRLKRWLPQQFVRQFPKLVAKRRR